MDSTVESASDVPVDLFQCVSRDASDTGAPNPMRLVVIQRRRSRCTEDGHGFMIGSRIARRRKSEKVEEPSVFPMRPEYFGGEYQAPPVGLGRKPEKW